MSDCFFISTLPEYLLDRKLIINNNHIHSINGYKLAKSSIIFKNQLIKLRQIELKNDPLHLNSLSNLKLQPFIIHYSNIYALECLLSFIHCNEETRYQLLYNNIQLSTIYSLLKVGLYFQIYEFTNDCLDIVQSKLNIENCLNFWKISEKKLFFKKISKFYKIIFNYLLIHFNEINKTKNFLKLNLIELKILLKNDLLNCLNEKYLFNIIIKWINYKKIERELYIYDLLTCLRLGRLSNEDLNDLSKHPIIQKMWNSCNHLLLMARSPNKELIPYLDSSWRRDKLTLNVGHAYSGCVLHKTQIYIIGGYVPSGPTQTLKVFELTNLKWKILSPMHEKRNYVCACSLNNYIYAIGGHNGKIRLRSVERYDIEQKQWFFVSPMHQVRSDAGAHSFSGYIYVVGGFDGDHFHDSVEMYDPRTDQWSLVAPMNSIRSGVSVIVYDHYLYAIGGNDGSQRLRTVERYNPNTNRWQMMPSMIHKRSNFCVTTLDEMIYVIGGWNDETNSTISSVERWSPNSSTHWEPVRELHIPASASCCCTVTGINLLLNFI
ncbi:kelch-like protein [Schistosoma mansoni]|uniref:kelch-like protein n=1 Tax=Schistosoma mansoni TaxID=6183 RepID=UPI0001A638A5|nr:kelch-like protein [Schistosoma mansoni]|eukprot:XP_018648420.1 kelch-like protein [Schistosoma mansoni]